MNSTNPQESRDAALDIAKAICIILMVAGHASPPAYLHDFIYMFHMPCFFFISGWLLSDRYLTDLKTGLLHKIKGTYWQLLKWSMIFTIFHFLFSETPFYNGDFTLSDLLRRVIDICLMKCSDELINGHWFLISLMMASVSSLLYLYVLRHCGKLSNPYIVGGVIVTLSLAVFCGMIVGFHPMAFSRAFMATSFYLTGYLCRRMKMFDNVSLLKGILAFVLPAILSLLVSLNMANVSGFEAVVCYCSAMSGVVGIMHLSKRIAKTRVAPWFAFVGSRTLYILMLHYFVFVCFNMVYLYLAKGSLQNARSLCLNELVGFGWLIYTFIGVLVPLIIWKFAHWKVIM